MKTPRVSCIAVALAFVVAITGADALAEGGATPHVTVRADEIGRSVTVMGRLDSPIGSVLSISGVWQKSQGRAKPGELLNFYVDEVNGRRLDSPVAFRDLDVAIVDSNENPIQPAVGARWALRAYESWPDYGHPLELDKELGKQVVARPSRSSTRLIGVLK